MDSRAIRSRGVYIRVALAYVSRMGDQLGLSLWVNDIDAPIKRAISQAAALGFAGIELSLDHPEIQPDALSESGRRHLARLVGNAGMTIASIAAPSGMPPLFHADQLVVNASMAMQMGRDMDVGRVTLHADFEAVKDAGVSGESATDASDRRMYSVLCGLAEVSDRFGVTLAVRGGSIDATLFSDLVVRVGCPTLRIAFDPLDVLVVGDDPVACLEQVSNQLETAYIRDALPRRGDWGGRACDLGDGALELDRYLADLSQCVSFERMILRGPHERRRLGDIESDIARLCRTGIVRGGK